MRFYGAIGYAVTTEESPGNFISTYKEVLYRGSLKRQQNRYNNNTTIESDVSISNKIKIVADSNLADNIVNIRYVVWHGIKWSIADIDATQRPSIIITLGGVYSG